MSHALSKRIFITILAAIFTIGATPFISTHAHAVPIKFIADGTLDFVDAGLAGTFNIGDAFHLEYTFESTTPDAAASNAIGRYNLAIKSLTVTVGTYSATASLASIQVNNNANIGDLYRIDVFDMVGLPVNGIALDSGQSPVLQMRDQTSSAFASDALPLAPLDPADFGTGAGKGTFLALLFSGRILATSAVDSMEIVPMTIIDCNGFMPPFDQSLSLKKKTKRAIPIDMVLTDAEGVTVTDADIVASPVINILFNAQVFGEVPPDSDDLLPLGSANDDNIFRFDLDEGQWIYNLGTKQFTAAGTYTVKVASGDTSEYTINAPNGECMQTFERLP